MKLSALLKRFGQSWKRIQGPASDIQLTGASSNSHRIEPRFVFFALKGAKAHGASFAPACVKFGARVVLAETPLNGESMKILRALPESTAVFEVQGLRSKIGEISTWIYGDPTSKLPVVAVTGTNGKTTTTFMLESIALAAGKKSGVIGTVACRVAGKQFPAALTTPQADELNAYFAFMLKSGCSYAFIEATSQALDLGRLEGLKPKGAVFTNLTRDHLDFHKTMENYFKAKSVLFSRLLIDSPWKEKFAAIHKDDPWGEKLLKNLSNKKEIRRLDFSARHTASVYASRIQESFEGISFDLNLGGGCYPVKLNLFGRHNVENALGAAGAASGLGIAPAAIVKGLSGLSGVPGRLERVKGPKDVLILVDYAHTDDALQNVLSACRGIPGLKRLICVFGCGGDRDSGKRPLMGKAASELANFAVLTSDNPRSEDPNKIIDQIESGIVKIGKTNYKKIVNREEAIHWAITNSRAGDCILIAGKGHENYQILADRVIHFDDREAAQEAVKVIQSPR